MPDAKPEAKSISHADWTIVPFPFLVPRVGNHVRCQAPSPSRVLPDRVFHARSVQFHFVSPSSRSFTSRRDHTRRGTGYAPPNSFRSTSLVSFRSGIHTLSLTAERAAGHSLFFLNRLLGSSILFSHCFYARFRGPLVSVNTLFPPIVPRKNDTTSYIDHQLSKQPPLPYTSSAKSA